MAVANRRRRFSGRRQGGYRSELKSSSRKPSGPSRPRSPTRDDLSVEDIQRAVCRHFRLSNSALLRKDRHKSVVLARQVAMYICRTRLTCSLPELGRAFGNRDHTTVLHGVRRVEALRNRDPQVKAHLRAILKRLADLE
jgi:chromosomal replication initiator protein